MTAFEIYLICVLGLIVAMSISLTIGFIGRTHEQTVLQMRLNQRQNQQPKGGEDHAQATRTETQSQSQDTGLSQTRKEVNREIQSS